MTGSFHLLSRFLESIYVVAGVPMSSLSKAKSWAIVYLVINHWILGKFLLLATVANTDLNLCVLGLG